MVLDESLAGVPVFSLPVFKPISLIFFANLLEAKSPIRPAAIFSSPTLINPFKKVPVVSIILIAPILLPSSNSTPFTVPLSMCISTTSPSIIVIFSSEAQIFCTASL